MALNWAMLDDSRRYVPINNENTVISVSKTDITLIIPGEVGGASNPKRLKENGILCLTDERLIFVKDDAGDSPMDTLSIPLLSVLSTSFVQPTFSANHLAIDIKPSPRGGLTEGTKAEIRFKDQPMFGFISALDKLREKASFMRRHDAFLRRDDAFLDDLPTYTSRTVSASSSPRVSVVPPAEPPPGYDA